MDDLVDIFEKLKNFRVQLQSQKEDAQKQLTAILQEPASKNPKTPFKDKTNLQSEKKRPKRLAALDEKDENSSQSSTSLFVESSNAVKEKQPLPRRCSPRLSARNAQKSNKNPILSTNTTTTNVSQSAGELMPPPVAPADVSSSISNTSHSRPQRAAKLDCSKHLKEASLKGKLRRPKGGDLGNIEIKVEHEQRQSQLHAGADADIENCCHQTTAAKNISQGISSTASSLSQDSVVALPTNEACTYYESSEEEENIPTTAATIVNDAESSKTARNLRDVLSTTTTNVSQSASESMPPPVAPAVLSSSIINTSHSRPQRAAKLDCSKHLEEASLKGKLRRPKGGDLGNIEIKVEHEQRQSQLHAGADADIENCCHQTTAAKNISQGISSTASSLSQDSVVALPTNETCTYFESSEEEENIPTTAATIVNDAESSKTARNLRDVLSTTTTNVSQSAGELMPPPVAPADVSSSISNTSHSRPQRAAKLDCSKHLKEASLKGKLRRPKGGDLGNIEIKVEHEQRQSQLHAGADADIENCCHQTTAAKNISQGISSTASSLSQDSVVALPTNETCTYFESSEEEENIPKTAATIVNDAESSKTARNLRVRFKPEKASTSMQKIQAKETEATTSLLSTTEAPQINATKTKESKRKKKLVPKPIKVERMSEVGDTSVSSRTRNRRKERGKVELSSENQNSKSDEIVEEAEKSPNCCKDKNVSSDAPAAVNETVTMTEQPPINSDSTMILGMAPNDATYCAASGEATFVVEAPNGQPVLGESPVNETVKMTEQPSINSDSTMILGMAPNDATYCAASGEATFVVEAPNGQPVLGEPPVNETVKMTEQPPINSDSTMILGMAPNDATYCAASGEATFVVEAPNGQPVLGESPSDLTFNVANGKATESQNSSMQSMEMARDTLQPNGSGSVMTQDESHECTGGQTAADAGKKDAAQIAIAPIVPSKPTDGIEAKALPVQHKSCKIPVRTIEIFNPLVHSPVKKKIEAYENAAAQAAGELKRIRSKQIKENALTSLRFGGSSSTPTIGMLKMSRLGQFLTPSKQSSTATITPNVMAQSKKVPSSQPTNGQNLVKSSSAGNIKSMASSAKAPSRENSGDDFRSGLHQLAEERKKQREQKHLLATQQREAKERERAERLTKAAKEREERCLKQQQEAEQRKRELEEIRKKLSEQEEIAAVEMAQYKAKALAEKENESNGAKPKIAMLPPPPPKYQKKYTFEMLHEYDSTDDEDKPSNQRPPPPIWSRSHVRGPAIQMQQAMPTDVVDSLFSVQPMTANLQEIFPDIDPSYLKRNSSAMWSTPP